MGKYDSDNSDGRCVSDYRDGSIMEIDISQYGKGAIYTPKPIRDRQFRVMAAAPLAATDWTIPYSIENGFILNQRDQKSSSSCTGQATCYYCEALNKIESQKTEKYSARFNYSKSFVPEGGAYIWKAMSIPLNPGAASQESVPDGDSSETIMRDGSLNGQAILEAKADKYAVIPRSSIDQMASIIKDYHGFVTGFNGWNGMFAPDGTIIDWSHSEWGHAVYVVGYEIRNGKKYLKFKNSWSGLWGSGGYGYFPEEFVNSGMMFDCYTYADITDINPNSMNIPTDAQLSELWKASFGREIDATGLAFWRGKSWDAVLVGINGSKEKQYYGKISSSVKEMENAIRTGQF